MVKEAQVLLMNAPQTAPIGLPRPAIDANPPPKVRFRESADNVSKHRALTENPALQKSLDFAVQQYQRDLANEVKDNNSALAVGFKIVAVQEFLRTFMSLSEVPKLPAPVVMDNLDLKA